MTGMDTEQIASDFAFLDEWEDRYRYIIELGKPLPPLPEAERTPELQKYMEQIGGVVNYVNQTFGLFKAAEGLRPKRLLTPKARD